MVRTWPRQDDCKRELGTQSLTEGHDVDGRYLTPHVNLLLFSVDTMADIWLLSSEMVIVSENWHFPSL